MAVLFLACSTGASAVDDYVLDFSQDNYKVVFISGNLTAATTYAWPRVVFHHSTSVLSPFFDVGFPRLYLFNDTNGDGMYQNYEEVYIGFLDEYFTEWAVIEPVKGLNSTLGQYVEFGMRSSISLFLDPLNMSASINDWANVTFWFRVCENSQTYQNSHGSYAVVGKTEMRINLTVEIRNYTETSGIVVAQSLQGGGSADMFLLKQQISETEENITMVSSRVDESPDGLNTTHGFNQVSAPRQNAWFSKDDWTSLAYYFWNSETDITSLDGSSSTAEVKSSFYTTGTGLMLYSVYQLDENTSTIATDMSIGIDESGFEIRVRDWIKQNLPALIGASAVISLIVIATAIIVRRKKRKAASAPP